MDRKKMMSDELLAKYMSGKATSEEEAAVLDYLAENEEHLDDFLSMTAAVELQKSKEKISVGRSVWKKFAWGISAAAAIAVLVIVGVFLFHNNSDESEQFAQQNQTEQISNGNPTEIVSDTLDSSTKQEISLKKLENGQVPANRELKQYADSAKKQNYANMLFPSKNNITLSSGKQAMTFRWNTDAVKVILTITNANGQVLLEKELKGEKKFAYTLPESYINWKTTFYFANGDIVSRTGEVNVFSN